MPTVGAYVDEITYQKYKKIADKKNITVSKVIKQALEKSKIIDEKKIANSQLEKVRQIKHVAKKIDEISEHVNTNRKLDVKVLMMMQEALNDCKNF